MMRKIVYTTCLLISLLFVGCGSYPQKGWILAYTVTSYGDGYEIYHENFKGLAYIARSYGGGYEAYNGNFESLAYTITDSGKIYRGNFEALVYEIVSSGGGYKIYF